MREDLDGPETVERPLESTSVLMDRVETGEFVVCTALVARDDWGTELERLPLVVTRLVAVACLDVEEVVVRPPVVWSTLVEVVWPILRELDEPTIVVGLTMLAERLAVEDTVLGVCSKGVETVVRLELADLVAVVWTELGGPVVLLELADLVAVVWIELGGLVVLLGLAELVTVVWTELGEAVVLLGLIGLVAVVWTEPGERVPSLAPVVDRPGPVVCFEVAERIVLPEFAAMLPVLVVCPGALERMLPPVLMACPELVACPEPIEELALTVFCAAAEVTERGIALVCREAAEVMSCPLVACPEEAEVVNCPGGACSGGACSGGA